MLRLRKPPKGLTGDKLIAWWAEERQRRQQIAVEREWHREWRESEIFMKQMQRVLAGCERRNTYCGAKTRPKTGEPHPCGLQPEPGKKRCKFHGGRSTGPRTSEGRARIVAAQRARWARWREGRLGRGQA